MPRVLPSAAMTRAARLASAASLLAALACQPEPTTAPDVGTDPSTGPEGLVAGGPAASDSSDVVDAAANESGAEEPTEPANDADPELAGDTGADPAPTTSEGASEPVASSEGTSANERAPLPKPIHKAGDGSCIKKFAVGEKVKGFKLPSLAGDKTISPAGYRNRVVLLNFWATWCKPCLQELPEFDRLYRKYRKHGMTLVAVTTDEDPKAVQDFVDQHKLAGKIALSGEKAAGEYGRPNFPFSFVVDGDGNIVAAFDYVSDACLGDLEQVLRDELEQL